MAKFYYAVKNGIVPGIYEAWAECEAQVKGCKGAKYKKFSTYDEALNFIEESGDFLRPGEKLKENEVIAYVDGSFDIKTRSFSYGVVLINDKDKKCLSGREYDRELAEMRNVAGEIKGAMVAMDESIRLGKDTLYLYYDYTGIEHWAKGDWKTNKEGTKRYKEFYDEIKSKLNVVFIKVRAHSGVEHNEEADRLAKEAIK
ncbi:RNase H [Tissierella creatinini]|nr:RNase H [Tissierella creatinini]TJX58962.1 RNase H [Soehngenia saccharolytica]